MDEILTKGWEFLKNGGALAACVLAFWALIKGTFLLAQHHKDVVAAKDEVIDGLKKENVQLRCDFAERLDDEKENARAWEGIARNSVGAGRVLSEVVAQKQLPPEGGR